MGVCNCSMFCCTLLYVHSSIAIILMGKRELIALLNLSSWCLVMVERLFLTVPQGCLQFVIVVFPDHTHLLFFIFENDVSSGIKYTKYTQNTQKLNTRSKLLPSSYFKTVTVSNTITNSDGEPFVPTANDLCPAAGHYQ